MSVTVLLGNTAVAEVHRVDKDKLERKTRSDLGNQVTRVSFPDDPPVRTSEALTTIRDLWPWHSDSDGPEWVEVENDEDGAAGERLAALIADEYTVDGHVCKVGRPKSWKEG